MSVPKIIVRYCHPCKASGNRVPCGIGAGGVNRDRRARIDGVIVNVCDMHGDAVSVARATVSGEGIDSRREAESTVWDADTATYLASEAVNVTALRESAYGYLTAAHVAQIRKAAYRRGMTTTERDSLYDIMLDESAKRIGDRLFRGEAFDVDRIVTVATFSQTPERKRRQDARLDLVYVGDTLTLGDAIDTAKSAEAANLAKGKAWRIGGMTVTEAEMTALVADYLANPTTVQGLTAEDRADLLATYAG